MAKSKNFFSVFSSIFCWLEFNMTGRQNLLVNFAIKTAPCTITKVESTQKGYWEISQYNKWGQLSFHPFSWIGPVNPHLWTVIYLLFQQFFPSLKTLSSGHFWWYGYSFDFIFLYLLIHSIIVQSTMALKITFPSKMLSQVVITTNDDKSRKMASSGLEI